MPDHELLQTIADWAAAALDRAERSRELIEVDHHRKEFLAVLMHELRGPLAPIELALRLLRCPPGDPSVFNRTHLGACILHALPQWGRSALPRLRPAPA